ncbi:uncharacterized protein [Diadema antillarum]|uniref:uncharacterized protein n=1 Tax=Diadema antillarum TaxID=105358 RepID=UPI003A85045C
MNILPKKSWHVRNRDNITRVKRDEAQAAEEEKKKEARIALAEQEARTELLRVRARSKPSAGLVHSQPPALNSAAAEDVPPTQAFLGDHINFFADIESGSKTATTNQDNEAEKKQEQEAYEKKIGLLTYLGQSSAESQTVKPWYQQGRQTEQDQSETNDIDTNDLKRKASLDPMNDMLRFLGKKSKKDGTGSKTTVDQTTSLTKTSVPKDTSSAESILSMFSKYRSKSEGDRSKEKDSHKHHKSKKKKKRHDTSRKSHRDSRGHRKNSHKDKKHKKHKQRSRSRRSDSDEESSSESGTESDSPRAKKSAPSRPSIEQLRAERLRREAAERAKTERLLSGKPLEEKPVTQSITDKLDGRYNSQFNPHLARKHQPKQPLF